MNNSSISSHILAMTRSIRNQKKADQVIACKGNTLKYNYIKAFNAFMPQVTDFKGYSGKLLPNNPRSSTKSAKSNKYNVDSYIMYLMPSTKLCPGSCTDCRRNCLFFTGRGAFSNVQAARSLRSTYYETDPAAFVGQLIREINALAAKYKKSRKLFTVRLNGTSDINFFEVYERCPDVQFIEYTKRSDIMELQLEKQLPNLSITYSYRGSWEECETYLRGGLNVAIVFNSQTLPPEYKGFRVIDGDISDLRHLDPKGVIVGLRLKGKPSDFTDNRFIVNL